jgi:hypothetical protein
MPPYRAGQLSSKVALCMTWFELNFNLIHRGNELSCPVLPYIPINLLNNQLVSITMGFFLLWMRVLSPVTSLWNTSTDIPIEKCKRFTNNSISLHDYLIMTISPATQERSQEFSRGGGGCLPAGKLVGPADYFPALYSPPAIFFSKGCAQAPFAHPLAATPK